MSDPGPEPTTGKGLLKYKISGIPTVYLIGGGLALGIGFYIYKTRTAGKTSGNASGIDTSGAVAGSSAGIDTSSTSGGNGGLGSPAPSTPVQQTNAQWARAALNAAIGNGSVNATDGANAVSAFLNGQQLTKPQQDIIAKLVTAYGQPPEGVLPIGPGSTPVDNSPAAYVRNSAGQISAVTGNGSSYVLSLPEWTALAAQGAEFTQLTDTNYTQTTHRYVVQPGDTWPSIAHRFYNTPINAPRNGAPLVVGSTIEIPLSEAK